MCVWGIPDRALRAPTLLPPVGTALGGSGSTPGVGFARCQAALTRWHPMRDDTCNYFPISWYNICVRTGVETWKLTCCLGQQWRWTIAIPGHFKSQLNVLSQVGIICKLKGSCCRSSGFKKKIYSWLVSIFWQCSGQTSFRNFRLLCSSLLYDLL